MGAKRRPFYRLVVADARSPRDGRFIEQLGTYDPLTSPATVKIDSERVTKWLAQGAQPSDAARSLLQREGILEAAVRPAATRTGPKNAAKAAARVEARKPKVEAAPVVSEVAAAEPVAAEEAVPEPAAQPAEVVAAAEPVGQAGTPVEAAAETAHDSVKAGAAEKEPA